MSQPSIDVIHALKSVLSEDQVSVETSVLESYGQDWTRFTQPAPLAVVFPRTTNEVADVVKFARAYGIALVPSGGRTGLSGGAVAANGEVVVSLDKRNAIYPVNKTDRTIQVGAGAITQAIQAAASEAGLFYPVDFASSGSSQIGGNIATNAGGINVIRYGMTREWVAGLTVVAGTGEILELNRGLMKNNTGLDFRHLFIGSEGVLGFITEATLKLCSPPKDPTVLVLAHSFQPFPHLISKIHRRPKMPDGQEHAFTDYSNHPLRDLPIDLTVCIGHARPRLRDVLNLTEGSILPLDRQIDDVVDLFVGEKLIARGQLIEVNEGAELAVQITQIFAGGSMF